MRRPLFAVGLALAVIMAVWLETEALREPSGQTGAAQPASGEAVMITGQVCRKDKNSFSLKSVVLYQIDQEAAISQQSIPYQEKCICETEGTQDILLGSTVTVRGRFEPFPQATNPGEFDSEAYYRSIGTFGRLADTEILSNEPPDFLLWEGLYRIRLLAKDRLYRIFPEKEAAVMSALLLGDREDLDDELKDLYKRNGILHILSISSLHITIMGMGLYRLLRRLGVPVWAAALTGGILMVLYGAMTGFGVSVCRAIGMYLLRMLAEITGRTYDMRNALGAVGICMLLYHPRYLQNSGFLLSFSSVLGIGVVYPALRQIWGERADSARYGESGMRKVVRKGRKRLYENALLSLSITLATLPVQLWFYYEVPVFGVVINLLVLPFVKPLLLAGAAALILPFPGAAGSLDRLILGWYEHLCLFFDALPLRLWNPGKPEAWQVAAYYTVLGLSLLWGSRLRKGKKRRPGEGRAGEADSERAGEGATVRGETSTGRAGETDSEGAGEGATVRERADRKKTEMGKVAEGKIMLLGSAVCRYGTVVCGILLAILLLAVRPGAENQVIFLNVGQGDCTIVRTASGQTYLLDCGSSSRSGVGRYVLLPFLKYNGIRRIDGIFLSHPDTDHVNGALELFSLAEESGICIEQLILPDIDETDKKEQLIELLDAAACAYEDRKVAVRYLAAGDSWQCGDAFFLCLHPASGYSGADTNAYSLCIYASFGKAGQPRMTALFTGDVEAEGETALCQALASYKIQNITLLKVAHHGSKNATSEAFLTQVCPDVAVISCGENNRYGHPHAEVLERLEQRGTILLQTWQSGAVKVRHRTAGAELSAFCIEIVQSGILTDNINF